MPKSLGDSGICQKAGRLLHKNTYKKAQNSPPDLREQTSALEIEGTEGAGSTGVPRALGERAQGGGLKEGRGLKEEHQLGVGEKYQEKTSCLPVKPVHSPDTDQIAQGGQGVNQQQRSDSSRPSGNRPASPLPRPQRAPPPPRRAGLGDWRWGLSNVLEPAHTFVQLSGILQTC